MTSAPAPLPALTYHTTPPGDTGWSAETKAIVAAAAVISFLSLLTWGFSLWMHLQPSAFRGRLLLQPWPSVDFARFVLHAVLNVAVIAGALMAFVSHKVARRVLLVSSLCLLAVALYQFASFSVFQTGLTNRREGADQVYWLVDDGARLVWMYTVHGLMLLALARPTSPGSPPGGGTVPVTDLIVAAAAVGAVVRLVQAGVSVWLSLQPSLFRTIRSGPFTAYRIVILSVTVLLILALIGGAALWLLRHRRVVARRLLLIGAAGLLALSVYGYVKFRVSPPPDFPREKGLERVKNTTSAIGRIITTEMIHGLLIFALTRRHVRGEGTATGGDV